MDRFDPPISFYQPGRLQIACDKDPIVQPSDGIAANPAAMLGKQDSFSIAQKDQSKIQT